MKLSEVCFREAVRLPGTQRRELLVRAKDVELLLGDPIMVTAIVGLDHVLIPATNVLWMTPEPSAVMATPVDSVPVTRQPDVVIRKRRG